MSSGSAMPEGHRNAPSPRGGAVLVSLYSWTTITIGVAITRLIISLIKKLDFGSDDGTVMAGSIVYVGATVAWQFAVDAGLGLHSRDLDAGNVEKVLKASYAAQLLLIAAMTLAKTSCVLLIDRVSAQSLMVKTFLFGMVAFWSIYSLMTLGLQCGTPEPWNFDPDNCSARGLSISVIVLNIMSDLVLAGWILPLLRHLRMETSQRMTAAALFGARALVPCIAGAQAWAAAKAMNSHDQTWDTFELTLLTQAVASMSLITASLPRIKRFLSVGGSSILYPRITETEIALSTRDMHSNLETARGASGYGSGNEGMVPLKLVPSSISNVLTTATSSGSKKHKGKSKIPSDWQKFVSMGSTQDEHTSTSSLCDQPGGVMLHHEVTVKIEDGSRQD